MKSSTKKHTVPLILREKEMEYDEKYKYLGCWVNEVGKDKKTADALTAVVGRSYERIVGLFKQLGDMGY